MSPIEIYHITSIDNLEEIIKSNVLFSHSELNRRGLSNVCIGVEAIKQRRLTKLRVSCHPNHFVGEFVPFYFCPRSVMLYLIYRGNHQDVQVIGGQRSIVHLRAELPPVVEWANNANRMWAFTNSNAGAKYTRFYNNLNQLNQLNWTSIHSRHWSNPQVQDEKQAEFLLYQSFPIELITKIGVFDASIKDRVNDILSRYMYRIPVGIEADWYY